VHQDPPDLRDHIGAAPPALAAVMRRALAKRPENRYSSASAMSEALRQALAAGHEDVDATLRSLEDGGTVLAPGVLAKIERALQTHVGPVARAMVDSAARSATSAEVLCNTLSRSIPDLDSRRAFLDAFRAGASTGSQLVVTPETLAQIERETAKFLGPIAKILVRRTLAKSASMKEFRVTLASHIEKEADRAALLQKLPQD
jgi:serine/threonine-protein kinase